LSWNPKLTMMWATAGIRKNKITRIAKIASATIAVLPGHGRSANAKMVAAP
jgi:hypothetical protein